MLGLIEIEMKVVKNADKIAKELTLALATDGAGDPNANASLSVAFGPFHAVAPMTMPTKLNGAP